MKPQRIELISHQVVLIPREHTSIVIEKGALKLEVRTSPMMYHSDT